MYFQVIKQWLKNQPKQKKRGLIGGFLFLIILTLTASFWFLTPHYGVLFNQLDSRDANQIMSQLEASNIPYQVRNQGSDILIDKAQIEKTRIKLMGSGMQLSGKVGFELFDKSDFGMTDFSQKINFQRALQGELERTIASLDEVKLARIHLVIPENHWFQEEDNLPRAALTLHLYRTLTPQQVRSIQQLVAASVARMPEKNVIILDQNGNQLTPHAEEENVHHFDDKKSVETYLTQKTMQMLKPVFGDEVLVKIDAKLNFDTLEKEIIEPQREGFVTHEKETHHIAPASKNKEAAINDLTHEKTYQLGNKKERFTKAPGSIEKLSISVLVPKGTEQDKLLQIERLVKPIVGFDAKRGDMISVEALLTHRDVSPTKPISEVYTPKRLSIYPWIILPLLLVCLGAGYQYRRIQLKKRQGLLIELTQWLAHHG